MVVRKGTKQLIEESFTELLAQKNIRSITVSDIASNCGISDRTFYYHFHDKYELIDEVFARLLNQALELWGDYEAVLQKSAEIVDEFSDYVVRAMESVSGLEAPIDRMAKRSSQMYLDRIVDTLGKDAATDKLAFQITYFNYLTIKATYDWAKAGKPQSTEALADWVLSCMPRELEPYLNPAQSR